MPSGCLVYEKPRLPKQIFLYDLVHEADMVIALNDVRFRGRTKVCGLACRPELRDKTSGMSENFARLSPHEMFERGLITPSRYWAWLTPRSRERVRWVMANHDGLTLAEALDDLWEVGGL